MTPIEGGERMRGAATTGLVICMAWASTPAWADAASTLIDQATARTAAGRRSDGHHSETVTRVRLWKEKNKADSSGTKSI